MFLGDMSSLLKNSFTSVWLSAQGSIFKVCRHNDSIIRYIGLELTG